MGQQLQKPHKDSTGISRHISPMIHKHSIHNIRSAGSKHYSWFPDTAYTKNSQFPDDNNWPTVQWTVGESKTVTASVNTSVGVTDSVVSASLGASYIKSHTVSTSMTRTFKVPYQKREELLLNTLDVVRLLNVTQLIILVIFLSLQRLVQAVLWAPHMELQLIFN